MTQPTPSSTVSLEQKGVLLEINTSHPSKIKQSVTQNLPKSDIATTGSNTSAVGLKIQTQEAEDQQATLTSDITPGETKKVTEDIGKVYTHQVSYTTHGPVSGTTNDGPIAMIYDCEVGWAPEVPGPNSAYWKRIKRDKPTEGPAIKLDSIGNKRLGPFLLQEIDPNVPHSKKLKEEKQTVKVQGKKTCEYNTNVDGSVVVAVRQPHRAQ